MSSLGRLRTLLTVGVAVAAIVGPVSSWLGSSKGQTITAPVLQQYGNFNSNQQGGVTNQTYINQAPEKLKFTDALGAELLAKLPNDKPITVQAVGSLSDLNVGRHVSEFLDAHGYRVALNTVGILIPPPDHALTWNPGASVLTVAPSVR